VCSSDLDLHVHSTASDGTLTPLQLVERAAAHGVSCFALTDHDTVDGLAEACAAGERAGVAVIPGIEISAACDRGTFHLLGYFIRYADRNFQATLTALQEARRQRNPKIIAKLNELGIPITLEEVTAQSGGGQIGRVHIARALVAKGWVSTVSDAFGRYLAKGRQAYFKKAFLTPVEAIEMIRRAGGAAVIAHPFSLEMTEAELRTVLQNLKKNGLAGLEVYYPMHTPEQTEFYARLAEEYGLLKTGGTDFHGENKPGVELGKGLRELGFDQNVVAELKSKSKF
jgi:hypothetical protein